MSTAATLIYPPSSLHLDDCDSFQWISVSIQKCPKHLFSSKATVVLLTCQTAPLLCWTSFSDISQNKSQKSWLWPAKPHTTREPWPQFLFFPWFTLLSCPDLIFSQHVWPAPTRGPELWLVPLPEFTPLHSLTSCMLLFRCHLLDVGFLYSCLILYLPPHLEPWFSLLCFDFSFSLAFIAF